METRGEQVHLPVFGGWLGLCGGAIYDDGAGLSASFSVGLATCLFETFVTCLLGFKCN